MRDPDLIVRAQRAATALESAWCHWRNVHGLTTEPAPTVSSYVGYSLDAPWGEARIVFGICAEEAEQLAVLLQGHDCFGPVHASVTARPIDGAGSAPPEDAAAQPGAAGWLHVPAPSPASAGQQPLPASAVGSRHGDELAPRHRGPARDPDGPSPLTAPRPPAGAEVGTPIARAASRAVEAAQASLGVPAATAPSQTGPAQAGPARTETARTDPAWAETARTETARADSARAESAETGARPGGGPEPERRGGEDDHPGPEATDVFDAIEGPEAPEVVAFRLKRPAAVTDYARLAPAPSADPGGTDDTVQTPSPGRTAAGRTAAGRAAASRDRVASAAVHADAATWAASEVPGQTAVADPAV
jgi:hypothetical protein